MQLRHIFLAVGISSLLLTACSGEEEIVPEMKPIQKAEAKEPKAQEVSAPENDDPELQPMGGSANSVAPQALAETSPAPVTLSQSQGKTGPYVIQVGIQPSRKGANAIIAKLKEQGIEAYLSEVENPGELEGTYYRVRVGYFSSIAEAKNFGKNVLEAAGFPWWVDNRANDSEGNPSGESQSEYSSYSSTHYSSEESSSVQEYEEPVRNEPMETEDSDPTPLPEESKASESAVPAPELEVDDSWD